MKTVPLGIVGLAFLCGAMGWVGFFKPYQQERILTFLVRSAIRLGQGTMSPNPLSRSVQAAGLGAAWDLGRKPTQVSARSAD